MEAFLTLIARPQQYSLMKYGYDLQYSKTWRYRHIYRQKNNVTTFKCFTNVHPNSWSCLLTLTVLFAMFFSSRVRLSCCFAIVETTPRRVFATFGPLPPRKIDTNINKPAVRGRSAAMISVTSLSFTRDKKHASNYPFTLPFSGNPFLYRTDIQWK